MRCAGGDTYFGDSKYSNSLKALASFFLLFVSAAPVLLLSPLVHAAESLRPSLVQTWPTATPEEVGIDSVPLIQMIDFIRERQLPVHSIQLVRRGQLVLDAYFYPYDGRTRH